MKMELFMVKGRGSEEYKELFKLLEDANPHDVARLLEALRNVSENVEVVVYVRPSATS